MTAVWLGNDDYSRMNESYGGNVPARIWARFMKAALTGTPPHDFPVPADEVAKEAACGGGHEYYLKGTEPLTPCGSTYAERDAQPYATLSAVCLVGTGTNPAASADAAPDRAAAARTDAAAHRAAAPMMLFDEPTFFN